MEEGGEEVWGRVKITAEEEQVYSLKGEANNPQVVLILLSPLPTLLTHSTENHASTTNTQLKEHTSSDIIVVSFFLLSKDSKWPATAF
jgi:hypothetical protein